MKKLNKILKSLLLDVAYTLPLIIIFTLIILQLVFNFEMIIYSISVIAVLVLSKFWFNFIEKMFNKQN